MDTKFKFFLLIFIFSRTFLFSQQQFKFEKGLFFSEVKKKSLSFESNSSFNKISDFFFHKKWDSIIIYSPKELNKSNQNNVVKDYIHFFRAFSFKQKKILGEAKKEFNSIDPKFHFYYAVKMFLGEIALEQSKFQEAIPYFKELVQLPEEYYVHIKKSTILYNLGLCYLHTNQFSKSEPHLIKSVKLYKENRDTLELIGSYGSLASLYYEQYKDSLAITYFEKAYFLSKKIKTIEEKKILNPILLNLNKKKFDLKKDAAKNMAVVEENKKNYQRALIFRKEMEQWIDSLNDQNRIYEVAKKEKEFAVAAKQKEVTLLETENKLKEAQRNSFIYVAGVLLILLLTSIYFYREKVIRNKIIATQKENLDTLNATKDKLFSIVSHDLRSSVNALKNSNTTLLDNLALKNIDALDSLLKKNSTIVNGAYGLLDNLLNWALLQTNGGYFHIESLHLFVIAKHVAYNYKPFILQKEIIFENLISKKDIVFADQESLKIILRNLLDNAIKFSNSNDHIKIYSQNISEEYCDLIIEDTGLGMTESTRLELLKDTTLLHKKEHENVIGTGLGLQLCKSMIKKNNGKFNIESELGKGTKMIVSLPKIFPR
mgnify:CR=1 FL=1